MCKMCKNVTFRDTTACHWGSTLKGTSSSVLKDSYTLRVHINNLRYYILWVVVPLKGTVFAHFSQQCQTSPVSLTKSSFPSLPALLCVSDPVLLQKVEAKIHPAENFYVNVKCRKLLCSHGNSLWSRCLQPSNFTSLGCHALKKNVFKKKPEKLFKIWCIIYLHFFSWLISLWKMV